MSFLTTDCLFLLQGKYINDPEVLREAAKKAGVADAEQVLSDSNVAKDQARTKILHKININ